jgi:hypothetical protein
VKTLILLIDFYGHPALTTDSYSDSVRYSHLAEIISAGHIDKTKCVFFSTTIDIRDEKLRELRDMAISKGFTFITPENDPNWVEHDDNYTMDYVKSKLKNYINIDHLDTQIILAGTNTSGCVFSSKDLSAINWYKNKYKTKIYLPMCAEYDNKGATDFERNMFGFASLYEKKNKERCFNMKIISRFNDLNISSS